jgi:hypothetical protein
MPSLINSGACSITDKLWPHTCAAWCVSTVEIGAAWVGRIGFLCDQVPHTEQTHLGETNNETGGVDL